MRFSAIIEGKQIHTGLLVTLGLMFHFNFISPDLLLLYFTFTGGPLEWSCGKLQLLVSVKSFNVL